VSEDTVKAEEALGTLRTWVEARDFAGYDPYDALNSPVLRLLSLGQKYGRIGWTQLMRRCPVNLRPMLGIRPAHNPKAIGLFLAGYSRLLQRDGHSEFVGTIRYLVSLIDRLRSKGYSGNCWGYDFDWQSRAAYVPRGTPTVVNTAFVGHALLDAYEATGFQDALALALPIRDFILRDLRRKVTAEGLCFSYTPVDENFVHNANLLGASILARLCAADPDEEAIEVAHTSVAYTIKHQRDDGSWYYAEPKMQRWVDSFHTGFNLHALRYCMEHGLATEHSDAYQRGVAYYARAFFLDDGTPKYYAGRLYPIDIHAPAEAITFFSGEEGYAGLVARVLRWTLDNMRDTRGFFYFRKGAFIRNRVAYMRWSQAWMFRALTEYLYHLGDGEL
jgi:hypothetical protein